MKTRDYVLLAVTVVVFGIVFIKIHILQNELDNRISGHRKSTEDKINDLRASVFLDQKSAVHESIELVARSATPEEASPLSIRETLVRRVGGKGKTYAEIEININGIVPGRCAKIPDGTLYWLVNNKRSLVLLNRQMHVLYYLPGEGWQIVSDQAPLHVEAPKRIVDDKNLAEILKDIK